MENQKPTSSSDEIDLGQLFNRIGDFFRNMGLGFLRFVATLRRIPIENKLAFILIIIASVVMGVTYSNLLKKSYYESTMILSSDYLNKRLVDNTIDKLNTLAEEKNKKGLGKVLNIPDSLANNILEFAAKPFVAESDLIEMEVLKEQLKNAQANAKNEKVIEQVVKRIEIENRHAFEITVRTLNPTVINLLQVALVNYFKNNQYIKNRIAVNRSNLIEKQRKLKSDGRKLDSLKSVIYENYKTMAAQGRQGSGNVFFSEKAATDPVAIYNQSLFVQAELEDVNEDIDLGKDFEVVDGFTEFSEPASASQLKIILISIGLGILLAYLLVGLVSFNKYLSTLDQQQNS
ncbi:MAG: hypothetical protein C0523_11115 [Cytophaga sp.]|nr:hypothetical protein [Cytophaga sp.]